MSNLQDYKPSRVNWIGDIPASWNLLRGRFLFESKKEMNRDLQCQNLLSLTLFGVLNKDYEATDGLRPENYNSYQIFQKDDLVFKMIDLENVKTSRVGIVHEEGIMSPVYIRHQPIKSKIDPRFAYWFYYDLYKKEIYNSIGSGVRSSLTSSDLLELELPVPSLGEQILISRYLDKKTSQIDLLIRKIEKKMGLLKEQRTSLINQCVTKGIKPNVEMKDSGVKWIGKIPKHWDRIRLKNLVSTKITDGPHETPVFVDMGVPFLSVEGVVNNKIDFNRIRGYISKETHEIYSKKCKPQKDDVLLVKSGSTTGKSTIVETDIEFNIWSPLCILRSDTKKINSLFLFNSVQSDYFKIQIETGWSYGTQPNIGMGVIENLWIALPPIDEQIEITKLLAGVTENFDTRIQKHQKKIQLLSEYRQSLISSAVTGKVRVSEGMI